MLRILKAYTIRLHIAFGIVSARQTRLFSRLSALYANFYPKRTVLFV